jgi:hypothetical protein
MTSVADVDRLVREDDQMVADLLPQLGPRVRSAYTADRNAWIARRAGAARGQAISAADLTKYQRAFAGWARALRAKAAASAGATRAKRAGRPASAAPAPMPAPASAAPPTGQAKSHRGVWLAAGLLAVGIVGLSGRRRHR